MKISKIQILQLCKTEKSLQTLLKTTGTNNNTLNVTIYNLIKNKFLIKIDSKYKTTDNGLTYITSNKNIRNNKTIKETYEIIEYTINTLIDTIFTDITYQERRNLEADIERCYFESTKTDHTSTLFMRALWEVHHDYYCETHNFDFNTAWDNNSKHIMNMFEEKKNKMIKLLKIGNKYNYDIVKFQKPKYKLKEIVFQLLHYFSINEHNRIETTLPIIFTHYSEDVNNKNTIHKLLFGIINID